MHWVDRYNWYHKESKWKVEWLTKQTSLSDWKGSHHSVNLLVSEKREMPARRFVESLDLLLFGIYLQIPLYLGFTPPLPHHFFRKVSTTSCQQLITSCCKCINLLESLFAHIKLSPPSIESWNCAIMVRRSRQRRCVDLLWHTYLFSPISPLFRPHRLPHHFHLRNGDVMMMFVIG